LATTKTMALTRREAITCKRSSKRARFSAGFVADGKESLLQWGRGGTRYALNSRRGAAKSFVSRVLFFRPFVYYTGGPAM
jgi:hypothetical protein